MQLSPLTRRQTAQDKNKAEVIASLRSMQEKAKTDPVWFAENILRLRALPTEPTLSTNTDLTWELDEWQKELLEAVADIYRKLIGLPTVINHEGKNYISIRAPQGPGKTFGVAIVMHWFNFCWPGLIAVTAPKLDQVKEQAWREFQKIRQRSVAQYSGLMRVDAEKITWGGKYKLPDGTVKEYTWVALARTGAQPENLQGLHDPHIMFIVDEATGVNDQLFPVVFGSLSTGFMRVLILIANPTKRTGVFAASHLNAEVSRDFFKMHIALEKTKRVKRSWVDQMIRHYGARHPAVLVRCYGEFADSSDYQLIPLEWIERARNREFDVERGDGSIPKLRVSVDVADGGEDETVIMVARHFFTHTVILKLFRHNFPAAVSPVMAAEAAMLVFTQWGGDSKNGDDIVVDAMGVGAGTAGTIMKRNETAKPENRINVITYRGGESADESAKCRNRRVQSYICLRNAFRDNTITLADTTVEDRDKWADVEAQLTSIRVKPASTHVEDLVTKEELKREGIKSPDIADAMAMQFATQAPAIITHQHGSQNIVTAVESHLMGDF